jgi:putative phosphoesterase
MKIAILSDIHSNKYALSRCLDFLNSKEIDKFLFLGDYFGYYPWAMETYDLLMKNLTKSEFILGNHDYFILNPNQAESLDFYAVIEKNRANLLEQGVNWLSGLSTLNKINLDGRDIFMLHGTPDDFLNGRFYPDNTANYDWFPGEKEILLMGHTHYPIIKRFSNGGIIINPGSVGQPRDGNLASSFCIMDTETDEIEIIRLPMPLDFIIEELRSLNWYEKAINSLRKTNK